MHFKYLDLDVPKIHTQSIGTRLSLKLFVRRINYKIFEIRKCLEHKLIEEVLTTFLLQRMVFRSKPTVKRNCKNLTIVFFSRSELQFSIFFPRNPF